MEDPSKESLVESRENLDCRDGDSLALKTDPSKESLGSIYRAVRTINGARGIPEASTLDSVTYVGEALLRLLRAGTPCATPAIIASLSVMMEGVREMRAHIDSAGGEAGKNRSALSAPPADGLEAFSAPLRVFQVMTREVMTLSPDKSFYEAVALMAHRSFRHLLVVDAEKRLRGVISDRDVLRALARTLNWNSASVSEIMTSEPVTVAPDSPISAAVKAMLAARVNCLPVVEADGKVCGILTSTDLMKIFEKIQALIEDSAPSASAAR
ncbi:MAG TPA: CBS domain-containing protein [Candidatus Binatia bacterium]|nr:CBS domain-containing protein [Candidatus Binatia bacterium]